MLDGDWDTCRGHGQGPGQGGRPRPRRVRRLRRAATAPPTWTRWPAASPPRPASRWCSTPPSPRCIEAGLQWLGGRAILNSANLEDGEAEGSRLDRVFKLAREYGAAVICLLIDEEGQARDVEWKLRVAHRIHDLAVDRYGLRARATCIFDALTFPLSTGDDDLPRRRHGHHRGHPPHQGRAARRAHHRSALSNVSLRPQAGGPPRPQLGVPARVRCEAGLDAAIVHAARIMPLNKIPEEQREVCLDLIYDRRDPPTATRRLRPAAGAAGRLRGRQRRPRWSRRTAPAGRSSSACRQRIIDGDRDGLEADLDEALAEGWPPLDIINDVLLAGMKVVGDLFGSGEMQLPFVLQSAETMKTAVAYLEPHMEKADVGRQGPHRAGHRQGRRARHRQEPGRHHPHQQRLRGAQPRHQDRASPR